jgi:hypothetical protein
MSIIIVKEPISKEELLRMAQGQFGNLIKAVIDVRQEIMAIGGELHADEEVFLTEQENSKREDTWGINLYPEKSREDMVEFDSMVNIKPAYGNRSRGVDDLAVQEGIKAIVGKLVK